MREGAGVGRMRAETRNGRTAMPTSGAMPRTAGKTERRNGQMTKVVQGNFRKPAVDAIAQAASGGMREVGAE